MMARSPKAWLLIARPATATRYSTNPNVVKSRCPQPAWLQHCCCLALARLPFVSILLYSFQAIFFLPLRPPASTAKAGHSIVSALLAFPPPRERHLATEAHSYLGAGGDCAGAGPGCTLPMPCPRLTSRPGRARYWGGSYWALWLTVACEGSTREGASLFICWLRMGLTGKCGRYRCSKACLDGAKDIGQHCKTQGALRKRPRSRLIRTVERRQTWMTCSLLVHRAVSRSEMRHAARSAVLAVG